jgi:hypothetical protein
MKMPNCGPGLVCLCLALLSACASTAPSPAPRLIEQACPIVSPCTLPAVMVRANGDLNLALERAEAAWAECAAVVDMVAACQAKAAP